MKKNILTGMILLISFFLKAQNNLPPEALKAIPVKYKITNQSFMKQGLLGRGEISLEVPNKLGCSDANLGNCYIKVNITVYDESQKEYLAMVEKRLPFQKRLPNALNYKPSVDPSNPSLKYEETKEIKLGGGSAAYYLQIINCIMDQNSSYKSISLKSLQGSTAKAIEIIIDGAISAEEAISIVNELYKGLSAVNYLSPQN
jgi:hypothetical protein